MKKQQLDLSRHLSWKKRKRILRFIGLGISGFILLSLIINLGFRLPRNLTQPADAILVLGGSIQREIYATELANEYPKLPILISQGSRVPCILDIFRVSAARQNNVWLERCADSTFQNFFFAAPILRLWGAHKVKVVTSPTHAPRAEWLARIQLGAQGMAIEMDVIRETGIPGNNESTLKTGLDITRSLLWSVFSQIIYPYCWDVMELSNIDRQDWAKEANQCESRLRLFKNLQRRKQNLGL